MTLRIARHSRSLLAALAVVAVSAGIAVAGRPASMPAAATPGLDRAAEAAGNTVPVRPVEARDAGVHVDSAASELVEASRPEAPEHPQNHGAAVSVAASGDTPTDSDNHGAYVKAIALENHGQGIAAESVGKHAVEHAADHAKGGPAAP